MRPSQAGAGPFTPLELSCETDTDATRAQWRAMFSEVFAALSSPPTTPGAAGAAGGGGAGGGLPAQPPSSAHHPAAVPLPCPATPPASASSPPALAPTIPIPPSAHPGPLQVCLWGLVSSPAFCCLVACIGAACSGSRAHGDTIIVAHQHVCGLPVGVGPPLRACEGERPVPGCPGVAGGPALASR